jgi:hypothetical protein
LQASAEDVWTVWLMTFPVEGIRMDMRVRGDQPLELILLDASFGLPPAGAAVERARPDHVVPIDDGDRTLVFAKASL